MFRPGLTPLGQEVMKECGFDSAPSYDRNAKDPEQEKAHVFILTAYMCVLLLTQC